MYWPDNGLTPRTGLTTPGRYVAFRWFVYARGDEKPADPDRDGRDVADDHQRQ